MMYICLLPPLSACTVFHKTNAPQVNAAPTDTHALCCLWGSCTDKMCTTVNLVHTALCTHASISVGWIHRVEFLAPRIYVCLKH